MVSATATVVPAARELVPVAPSATVEVAEIAHASDADWVTVTAETLVKARSTPFTSDTVVQSIGSSASNVKAIVAEVDVVASAVRVNTGGVSVITPSAAISARSSPRAMTLS